jgi:hypothetical protein
MKKDKNATPASQQSSGGNSSSTPTSASTLPPGDGPVSRADHNKMVAAKDKYKHSYTTSLLARGDDQSVTPSEYTNFQTVEIAGVPSGMNDTLPDRSFLQQLVSPLAFKQSSLDDLNLRDKVLLDSQSTIDLYCNPRMVTDHIRKASTQA